MIIIGRSHEIYFALIGNASPASMEFAVFAAVLARLVESEAVLAAVGTVLLVDLVPGHSTTGLVRRSADPHHDRSGTLMLARQRGDRMGFAPRLAFRFVPKLTARPLT
jgi:hypothetical protein